MIRKILILVASNFLLIAAGSYSIYPLYTVVMTNKFKFTSTETNLYSTFIDLGYFIAFPMGAFYDRFGHRLSLFVSGITIPLGYFFLQLLMNQDEGSIFQFLVVGFIIGQGSVLSKITAISINLKNFKFKDTSAMVGLLMSNLAISASIFSSYKKEALPEITIQSFFTYIIIFIVVVICLCLFLFNTVKNEDVNYSDFNIFKEKRMISILILFNIGILIFYVIGLVINKMVGSTTIPNFIIFPILKCLNFIVIIVEMMKCWDEEFFRRYIEREIKRHQILLEKVEKKKIKDAPEKQVQPAIEQNNHNQPDLLNKEEETIKENHHQQELINSKVEPSIELEVANQRIEVDSKEAEESKSQKGNADVSNQTKVNRFSSVSFRDQDFLDSSKQNNSIRSHDIKVELNSQVRNDEASKIKDQLDLKISREIDARSLRESHIIVTEPKLRTERIIREEEALKKDEELLEHNAINEIGRDLKNDDVDFIVVLKSHSIWSLFFIQLILEGTILSNINNINYLVDSLYEDETDTNFLAATVYDYIIIFFICNALARLVMGVIISKFIKKNNFYWCIVLVTITCLISQSMSIFMNSFLVFISMGLLGFAQAGLSTFSTMFVRIEYGLKSFGKLLGLIYVGNALGIVIISNNLFVSFYSKDDTGKCKGPSCFRGGFIINSCLSIISVGLSVQMYKWFKAKYEVKISKEMQLKLTLEKLQLPKIQDQENNIDQ